MSSILPLSERPPRPSAYYAGPVSEFLSLGSQAVLGALAADNPFRLEPTQRDAWLIQVPVLQGALNEVGRPGHIFLEFDVPRLGSRIDTVLILGSAIFPIEFKVGASKFQRADINQVWDYGLDLKNFHQGSHEAEILPILVATEASDPQARWESPAPDGVFPPLKCSSSSLARGLAEGLTRTRGRVVDGDAWGRAPYQPTPTIVQAASALYAQHSVDAISRHDAGARNLTITSRRVEAVVEDARSTGQKAIVFVTGVPGAGKTLVGLNVATQRRAANEDSHAVFLSGNGPLVEVLREALTRDEQARRRLRGTRARKGEVQQEVKSFIQNVHHFRDDGLRDTENPPHDHVVIFDEAQRAWNLKKTADFMKRRKGLAGFSQSEPDFLISYMDRHHDWAVVVCLVGGGQEIHTGEAGIGAWLDAVRNRFPHWHVYISPRLSDSEYSALSAVDELKATRVVHQDAAFHLAVSMRSFRAEHVSSFVKAVLDCDEETARTALADVMRRYPLALTRNLDVAKQWVRDRARGSERYGLVASSQAQRLRPHAIDVRAKANPVHWFLNDEKDVRSSFHLEDPATEFTIQGLEVDWVCMTWDADLRYSKSGWQYREFRGTKWNKVRTEERQRYLLNAYRVLLTRARQGMVIFVPPGERRDQTRYPAFYDQTFDYLAGLGIPEVT